MREGPEPRHKTEILKPALLAAGLLFGYDHGPARAVEIPRETSWTQGIDELHRRSKEETIEYGTDFLIYADGSTDWLPDVHGDESSVSSTAEAMAQATVSSAQGRMITLQCHIHTHPFKTAQKKGGVYETTVPYMPPSGVDVNPVSLGRYNYVKQTAHIRSTQENIFGAVVEPHGVWYYRTYTETGEDLKHDDPEHYDLREREKYIRNT